MTEFDKADTNNNGVIERVEWNKLALEDRRLEMIDRDLKRNAERRFTGFALMGMLIYPFIILCICCCLRLSSCFLCFRFLASFDRTSFLALGP